MAMIPPEKFLKEFAERTIANLILVEQFCDPDKEPEYEAYEATQLINSLLGLVVFPKERDFDSIPQTPFDQLTECQGIEASSNCGNFKELIMRIRHAAAHCNMRLTGTDTIDGVFLWNTPPHDPNTTIWKHEFTLDQIRNIAFALHDMLHSIDVDHQE